VQFQGARDAYSCGAFDALIVVGCGETEFGLTIRLLVWTPVCPLCVTWDGATGEDGRALAVVEPPEQPEIAAAAKSIALEKKRVRMDVLNAPRNSFVVSSFDILRPRRARSSRFAK
jgi:hypothetical protein